MYTKVVQLVHPPRTIDAAWPRPWVFLAGSIDQGHAVDWQASVADAMTDRSGTLFNPRRPDWDASWKQSADDPQFRGQVAWELEALERADTIALFFAPTSKAPISLLELGLFVRPDNRTGTMVVACPAGYWRKGNVDIVCERYGAQQVDDLAGLIAALRNR